MAGLLIKDLESNFDGNNIKYKDIGLQDHVGDEQSSPHLCGIPFGLLEEKDRLASANDTVVDSVKT